MAASAPSFDRTISGASSGSNKEPQELEDIGQAPFNEYHITLIGDRSSGNFWGYMPTGGFTGKLAREAGSGKLKEALAKYLEVPTEGISLVYEGKNLEDNLTLKDNGILEPGAAARKRGQGRIGMQFMLSDGVELGGAKRDKQEAEEAAQQALQARLAAEQQIRDAEKKAREEAEERERAARREEERAAQEAKVREEDRCILRCRLLDAEDGWHEVRTQLSATARDLAWAICQDRGMRVDEDHGQLMLVHGEGNILGAGNSLRDSGVKTGDEVQYFWG